MNSKKVLLFGSNGLVGHYLNDKLKSDYLVYTFSRNHTSFYSYDFFSLDSYNYFLTEIDTVIFLISGDPQFSDFILNPTYVNKFKLFLNELKFSNITKFIYFSSGGAIYGNNKDVSYENDRLKPISNYGKEKVLFESLINDHLNDSNVKYFIIRPSNIYGYYNRKYKGVVNQIIKNFHQGDSFQLNVDLKTKRDFVHIYDIYTATKILLDLDLESNIFNIGSSESNSIEYLIELMEIYFNKKLNINHVVNSKKYIKFNCLNIDKFHKYTGWLPSFTFENGIKDICLEYLKK